MAKSSKRVKRHNKSFGKLLPIEGLRVKNLIRPINLVITEQDCKVGSSKAPSSCAAALALRRLPNCSEARVHVARVFLKMRNANGKQYWLRGKTPASLRTEIAAFDRGGTFEPGTYTINPLCKSERPDGKKRGLDPELGHGRPGHHRRKAKILKNVRRNGHFEYGKSASQ